MKPTKRDVAAVIGASLILTAPTQAVDAPPFLTSWGCTGPYLWTHCHGAGTPGALQYPSGIAVDDSGSVYVCDLGNDQIQVFTTHGVFERLWGADGDEPARLSRPGAVDVGSDGLIYVADRGDDLPFHVFTPDGDFVRAWDGTNHAGDLQVANDGTVWVADEFSGRVLQYSNAGEPLHDWHPAFFGARAVLPMHDGTVLVGTGQGVHRFTIDGVLLESIADLESDHLGQVRDLELDDEGRLLVSSDHLYLFELDGTPLVEWKIEDPFRDAGLMNWNVAVHGGFVFTVSPLTGRVVANGWVTRLYASHADVTLLADGVERSSPAFLDWDPGTTHEIGTTVEQGDGIVARYEFVEWSDGGAASHEVVVPEDFGAYTADFSAEYFLDIEGDPELVTTPPSGWYPGETALEIRAVSAGGSFARVLWAGTGPGSYSGPDNAATIFPEGPVTEFATFVEEGSGRVNLTLSASAVDPFVHTDDAADGIRSVYLWLTCAQVGIGSLEAGVGGGLTIVGFNPMNGVVNLGTGSELLLAIPQCPAGSDVRILLGEWIVWDTGGTLCLQPSAANSWVIAAGCDGTDSTVPNVVGFSSDETDPCSWGDAGLCTGSVPIVLAAGGGASSSPTALRTVFPNPFHERVSVSFSLARDENVRVRVFDVHGRLVRDLNDRVVPAGSHVIAWDGRGGSGLRAAAGIYFVRFEAGDATIVKKLVRLTR